MRKLKLTSAEHLVQVNVAPIESAPATSGPADVQTSAPPACADDNGEARAAHPLNPQPSIKISNFDQETQ